MSSERFEIIENDLEDQFDQLEIVLDGMRRKKRRNDLSGNAEDVAGFRRDLLELKRSIDSMEREAKNAPHKFRGQMLEKVRAFREKSAKLQSRLKLEHQHEQQSISLMTSEDEILQSTSQSLARSQQVALESEDVGNEILTDLGVQREALERTRVRLQETDAELSRSKRILRKMYFGVIQNKALLIVVIVVEVCILLALIYSKYIKK